MKKKGFELSINFLVVLIITLVVFIFAIAFAYKFFGKAGEMKASIDQRTKSEIQTLIMSQGMKVAVYPTQISMYAGESESLGVGILNVLGSEKEFAVTLECTKCISETECFCNDMQWVIQSPITIQNNKDEIVAGVIGAADDAESGTYVFDINVEYGDNGMKNYGGLQKVYVKI